MHNVFKRLHAHVRHYHRHPRRRPKHYRLKNIRKEGKGWEFDVTTPKGKLLCKASLGHENILLGVETIYDDKCWIRYLKLELISGILRTYWRTGNVPLEWHQPIAPENIVKLCPTALLGRGTKAWLREALDE